MASIARIRLAPGETGYYDEVSNISMNWRQPEAEVPEGTDCRMLRKSVKMRRIIVLEGDLGRSKSFKQILMEKKAARTGKTLEELMGDSPIAYEAKATIVQNDNSNGVSSFTGSNHGVSPSLFSMTPPASTAEDDNTPDEPEEVTEPEEITEPEEEETLTVSPKSIKSLIVGNTRDIAVSHVVTSVESTDENIVTAEMSDKTVTIMGITAGKANVVINTAIGSFSLPVTVKAE